MTAVIVPKLIPSAIQVNRWIRNGLVVDAGLQSGLTRVANQIGCWRTKEVFRWNGVIGLDSGGSEIVPGSASGETQRWRFAFRTGPFAKQMGVRFFVCMQDTVGGVGTDAYSRLRILTTGGATVGDGTFHYGNGPTSTILPSNCAQGDAYIAVSPSTDYTAVISQFDNAKLIAATVYEMSLEPDTSNGYISSSYAAQTPIYDTDRSDPMTVARSMWLDGPAHLMNWSVLVQSSPRTSTILTYTNPIDNLSTGVDGTTPGFTIDLTHSDRVSETSGVPVVLQVYGQWGGGIGTGGTVRFRNQSGSVSQTIGGFTVAGGWQSVAFTMPATSDKYDLQYATTTGGTAFNLYAASLYQKGT